MKKLIIYSLAAAIILTACAKKENTNQAGEELFATVKQFVALGEHRTGTPVDSLTSAWLKIKLDSIGAKTEFVEFSLNQFLFEGGRIVVNGQQTNVFPVWPVKPGLNLSVKAEAVDGDKLLRLSDAKDKLVLTRFKNAHGASTPETAAQISAFIKAGAKGVLVSTGGSTGEIVALNTFDGLKPWEVPVYHLAPKDTHLVLSAIRKKTLLSIEIKGATKDIKARDIVARIGSGAKYVVVSTPISGWFTTGGERGPGIAVWLGLAEWVQANSDKYPGYTFLFTGNSGHELGYTGAKAFVEKAAPKPEDTKLWIHLGAAVAVREWKQENGTWTLTDSVDSKRGIYYSQSVAKAFEKSFANTKAYKQKGTLQNRGTVKAGGEGAIFQKHGYDNLVSIAHGHRLHHVKTDREDATSPALLQELELTLQYFIEEQLKSEK